MAAIRGMTVEQQAELIGGWVERSQCDECAAKDAPCSRSARAVSEWGPS